MQSSLEARPSHAASTETKQGSLACAPGLIHLGVAKEVAGILRVLGVDPDVVIAGAGINPRLFDTADCVLSARVFARLLRHCAERTKCSHFGILLGAEATLVAFGLLGCLMRSCDTLGDALRVLEVHLRIQDSSAVMRLEVDEEVAVLSYAPYEAGVEEPGLIAEFALARTVHALRHLCGLGWALSEVLIPRRQPANTSVYLACFGAPVSFDREIAALVFPAKLLSMRLVSADSAMRRAAEGRVLELERTCRCDLTDELRRMLRTELLKGRCLIADAARSLSIHPRTFNRRLKAAGTGFRTLADEMRFEIARQLIADTEMPLGRVSAVLDFSEPAAFTRAFQRWSGVTPSVWRSWHRPASADGRESVLSCRRRGRRIRLLAHDRRGVVGRLPGRSARFGFIAGKPRNHYVADPRDRRTLLDRGSPGRTNGHACIQPAHQSLITNVFGPRLRLCTIDQSAVRRTARCNMTSCARSA